MKVDNLLPYIYGTRYITKYTDSLLYHIVINSDYKLFKKIIKKYPKIFVNTISTYPSDVLIYHISTNYKFIKLLIKYNVDCNISKNFINIFINSKIIKLLCNNRSKLNLTNKSFEYIYNRHIIYKLYKINPYYISNV